MCGIICEISKQETRTEFVMRIKDEERKQDEDETRGRYCADVDFSGDSLLLLLLT